MDSERMEPDIYSADILEECEKRCTAIRTAINSIEKNFKKIAFNLYWIYSSKVYRSYGFLSITDYAASTFGFSKSSTYNYLMLVERFGNIPEAEKVQGTDILATEVKSFRREYESYSSSQLIEMVTLSDEEIEKTILPSMSVRDIRKMAKAVSRQKEMDADDIPGTIPDIIKPDVTGLDDTDSDGQKAMVIIGNDISAPGFDVPPGNVDGQPEVINSGLYSMEIYVDGIIVDLKHWNVIDSNFIADSLTYHPERVLVFRSCMND